MDESLFIPADVGVLKGSVLARGKTWLGRWTVKHGGATMSRSSTIGYIADMTEAEARRRVAFLADRDQQRALAMPDSRAAHFKSRSVKDVQISKAIARESVMSGELGELAVCMELIANGFDTYKAINRNARFDLIAARGGELFRIEVKRGTMYKTGRLDCEISNHGSFDVLAFVNHDGTIHYIPWFNLDRKKRSRIRNSQTIEACLQQIEDYRKSGTIVAQGQDEKSANCMKTIPM
jgi:hypothetical protein